MIFNVVKIYENEQSRNEQYTFRFSRHVVNTARYTYCKVTVVIVSNVATVNFIEIVVSIHHCFINTTNTSIWYHRFNSIGTSSICI